MAGISIQMKNASYYGAIHNKKSSAGVVGVSTGRYVKNSKNKSTVSVKAAQSTSAQKEERQQKLAALEKTTVSVSSDEKLTQEELAERLETNKKKAKQVKFVGTSVNKKDGYLNLTNATTSKKDTKTKKKLNYSYKDVSSKIQRAKNSVSAGQAVISAKRKVMELRRKASSGNVDSEDLQLALSHAKRMESIAKKKKHNLELEEMVEQVQARDEKLDEMKDSSGSQTGMIDVAKDTIERAEDEIREQQEEYADGIRAEFEELAEEYELDDEMTEELSEEMSQMIEEFGQEEMELLEETMEMLEQMEAVNPHMSDEQLENLKRKHRASEDKALTKANMDYLKGVIKQLEKESHKSSQAAVAPQACAYSPASIVCPSITVNAPEGISIDVGC